MNENKSNDERFQFFVEKGVELSVEHDKILVTLFTGIIAGLIALLISTTVGFWSAVFFVVAALSSVVGLAMCLMHMAFSAKVLFSSAAKASGDLEVPNLFGKAQPTEIILARDGAFTQCCYIGQLTCLLWAVFFAAIGLVSIVWGELGIAGMAICTVLVTGLLFSTFKPLIQIYSITRRLIEQRGKQNSEDQSVSNS